MERSHTLCSFTLRQLLLGAPLLIALSAPVAAHTQVQKTDERLKTVEAVTPGPGAAIGGIHGDVTGGPVGLAIAGKGGYVLAEAGEKDEKQKQLTQKERKEREKDKDDDEDDDKKPSPHKHHKHHKHEDKHDKHDDKDKHDD